MVLLLFFSFIFNSAKSENQQGAYKWPALLGKSQPGMKQSWCDSSCFIISIGLLEAMPFESV